MDHLRFLVVFALTLWLGFERKTTCDVETEKGTPCGDLAYGYLRACFRPRHKKIKRAALLSYIGIGKANPSIMWARNSGRVHTLGARQPAPSEPADAALARGGFRECATFLCCIVSAAVAVVGLLFQILTFAGLGST